MGRNPTALGRVNTLPSTQVLCTVNVVCVALAKRVTNKFQAGVGVSSASRVHSLPTDGGGTTGAAEGPRREVQPGDGRAQAEAGGQLAAARGADRQLQRPAGHGGREQKGGSARRSGCSESLRRIRGDNSGLIHVFADLKL